VIATHDTPADVRDKAIRDYPRFASVMTGNPVQNRCILETANHLMVSRADYIAMAAIVCQAADKLSR
jgi:hypothetical protein